MSGQPTTTPDAPAGAPTPRGLLATLSQTVPMPLQGTLRCEPEEMLALVGPSGAGKTSLLRCLAGLMRPTKGRIEVGTSVWCDTAQGVFVPPQRRPVGLVFQHYALMPHLSAQDNVALALLHLPRAERLRQARHWLDHVHLNPEQQLRRPAELSGGQQQRVAVARALARQPGLLLLDEPFSAVDQLSRLKLYQLLGELRRELRIPIVLVTHDLAEARRLCDQMVVMDQGQMLQQGSPAALHRSPRNARVADLVGIQNRFEATFEHGPGQAGTGWATLVWRGSGGSDGSSAVRLTVRDKGKIDPGTPVHWVVAGEGLELAPNAAPHAAPDAAPDSHSHSPNTLACRVLELLPLGEISLCQLEPVDLPGEVIRVYVTAAQRAALEAREAEGAAEVGPRWVQLRLLPEALHVMPTRLG